MDLLTKNAKTLQEELTWFQKLLEYRGEVFHEGYTLNYELLLKKNPPPIFSEKASAYAKILDSFKVNFIERVILVLAITPHLRPELLDGFFLVRNKNLKRNYTEFGGILGEKYNGFMPTGETAAFIVAGDNLQIRFSLFSIFNKDHFFVQENILRLEKTRDSEPTLSGTLTVSKEFLTLITTGKHYKPDYSIHFPASRITTKMDWNDLLVDYDTQSYINEIKAWLESGEKLLRLDKLGKKVKRGYRCLFYGPPGTGKTLTATLLGKNNKLDVYRIDLSMVVSKYIGETEKNLANLFEQAENKNWILFFDEADALFGKRTQTKDSKDRYANQEISYLLQRIEDFPGLVILATNRKSDMDEAFARRFQSMIYFAMPSPELRLELWQETLPDDLKLEKGIHLEEIAKKYELSGGAILNVAAYCSLITLNKGRKTITYTDLLLGIKREFKKEGKTI